MKPEHVADDLKNVLMSREEIDQVVRDLAARIDEDYAGRDRYVTARRTGS